MVIATVASGLRFVDMSDYSRYETTLDEPGGINQVEFSPDGTLMAYSKLMSSIRLNGGEGWGDSLALLRKHSDLISGLIFNPAGDLLASSSFDGSIRFWDVTNGEELMFIDMPTSQIKNIAFNSDGTLLASIDFDNEIKLWAVK